MRQVILNLAEGLVEIHKKTADIKEFKKHARIFLQHAYDQGASDALAPKQTPVSRPQNEALGPSGENPGAETPSKAKAAGRGKAASQKGSETTIVVASPEDAAKALDSF